MGSSHAWRARASRLRYRLVIGVSSDRCNAGTPDGFTVEFAEGRRGDNATSPDAIARQAPRSD